MAQCGKNAFQKALQRNGFQKRHPMSIRTKPKCLLECLLPFAEHDSCNYFLMKTEPSNP